MTLTQNDVHLYYVDADTQRHTMDTYWAYLSEDEKERAQRFIKPQDGENYSLCRGVLRQLISHYLNIPAATVQFNEGKYGKPAIIAEQNSIDLQFNLSHTKGHFLFGFCLKNTIGVDIETTTRTADIDGVAEQVFSERELQDYQTLPEQDKTIGFFNGWTRKEAFIKAIGLGFSFPLKNFSVSINPNVAAEILEINDADYEKQQWQMQSYTITDTLLAAVVIETKDNHTPQYHTFFNEPLKLTQN